MGLALEGGRSPVNPWQRLPWGPQREALGLGSTSFEQAWQWALRAAWLCCEPYPLRPTSNIGFGRTIH